MCMIGEGKAGYRWVRKGRVVSLGVGLVLWGLLAFSAYALPDVQKGEALGVESPVGARVDSSVVSPAKRPKIGLLLSGGGARGLAHIGVLQVLDSLGIVPDYIAGTSMGAIVGALYAMGYTPNQIAYLNSTANWDYLLSNIIPLKDIAIDRKSEVGRSHMLFTWRNGGFHLPMGFIESQSLWNFFYRLTWSVQGYTHFDQMPIPFRCCAVNMANAKVRIFDRGSLPTAMRASMAVPGIFSPVVSGDTAIYVDGGVSNNFPYDVLKDMGSDIIIGVYTGPHSLVQENRAVTVRNILVNASMFHGYKRALDDMPRCDLLIIPPLGATSSANFSGGKDIIRLGYDAALPYTVQLKALRDSVYAHHPPERPKPVDSLFDLRVSRMEIQGVDRGAREFVSRRFGLNPPTFLRANELEKKINELYHTLYFRRITYDVEPDGTLKVYPELADRLSLGLGLHLNETWGPSLIGRFVLLSPLERFGRLNIDVEAAVQPRMNVWYTTYFSNSMQGLFSTGANYSFARLPIYKGKTKITSLWQHEIDTEMKLGYLPKPYVIFESGVNYHFTSTKPSPQYIVWKNLVDTGRISNHDVSVFLGVQLHTIDRHFYPTNGVKFYARSHYFVYTNNPTLGREDLPQAEDTIREAFARSPHTFSVVAKVDGYISPCSWFTTEMGLHYGLSTQRRGDLTGFRVGGHSVTKRHDYYDVSTLGLHYRQIHTFNYMRFSFGARFRLWNEVYLAARGNYLLSHNDMKEFFKNFIHPQNNIISGGIALGWLSRFGLIEVSGMTNSRFQQPVFHLTMGFPF